MTKALYISELNDLNEEKLYINKYDSSIISLVELNRYWKEFAFDIIEKMPDRNILPKNNLLTFIKNNYKMLIEKTNIDFNDYVELNDYITFIEWEALGNTYTII